MSRINQSQWFSLKRVRSGYFKAFFFVLLMAFLLTQLSWRYEKTNVSWQGEARTNPFAAAQYFLKQHGKQVETLIGNALLGRDLSEADVIFLSRQRYSLREQQVEELLNWVRGGGHLMAALQSQNSRDQRLNRDTLFEALGVTFADTSNESCSDDCRHQGRAPGEDTRSELQRAEVGRDDRREENKEKSQVGNHSEQIMDWRDQLEHCDAVKLIDSDNLCDQAIERRLLSVVLPKTGERALSYMLNSGALIEAGAGGSIVIGRHPEGPKIRYLDYGKGQVTLMVDDQMWRNHYIDLFDHAYLLSGLVGSAGSIWLMRDIGSYPHWLKLLWQNAWPLVISVLVLGFCYIWKSSMRIGPIRTLVQRDARNSSESSGNVVEHVDASNRFYEKYLGGEPLLTAVQKEVQSLLKKKMGGIEPSLATYQRIADDFYAADPSMTSDRIVQAFQPWSEPMSLTQFYEAIRLLKQIRDNL